VYADVGRVLSMGYDEPPPDPSQWDAAVRWGKSASEGKRGWGSTVRGEMPGKGGGLHLAPCPPPREGCMGRSLAQV
jgi:hypothetical protein